MEYLVWSYQKKYFNESCLREYIYIRKIVFELFHVTNGISFVLSYVMLPVEIFVKTFSRSIREGKGTPT